MKSVVFIWVISISSGLLQAQEIIISGKILHANSQNIIGGVSVRLEDRFTEASTNTEGIFILSFTDLEMGNYILNISKLGFQSLRLPILLDRSTLDLGVISLTPDIAEQQAQLGSVNLSENELDDDQIDAGFSSILNAGKDAFLNAAAYDFSQTYFKTRGYDSQYGLVMINGIALNKINNGRPQWSNWGGLNDVQRNQDFNFAVSAVDNNFGSLAGSTNFVMRASKFSKGGRLTLSAANRSYRSRIMATYSSGELKNNWFYTVSLSGRFAEEGYMEGTSYNAKSAFLSVEKKINEDHSLNFAAIYTPNIRGKSAAITDEVFELKGRKYNSYWGYQGDQIRNSRQRRVEEPILMLNHFWELSKGTQITTNIAYQFGKIGNTRIDYGGTNLVRFNDQVSYDGGGQNPDPAYYQNLPSYFLRFEGSENYEAAYRSAGAFQENGQLNWDAIYEANRTEANAGNNAVYALTEDRNDDRSVFLNTTFDHQLNSNLMLNGGINFQQLKSHNYAKIDDLFGRNRFLDIDFFAEPTNDFSLEQVAQSDLQNPNRLVGENEIYKYNYDLNSTKFEAFSQLQFIAKNIETYLSAKISSTNYDRFGNYQNGLFPDNSLGQSAILHFIDFGLKTGITYHFTGRHSISSNLFLASNPPTLQNSLANPRQNNTLVQDLDSEQIYSADATYRYRSPNFNLKISGYFTQFRNVTDVSFYYVDGLSGLGRNTTTAFVQEILYDAEKQHLGIEFGTEAQVTSTIKLKSALAVGQFIFSNNPNLYLTSNSFAGNVNYGEARLKNYRLANGPQHAAQLGFEYRDPDYWWFGLTANYFANAFINVSPLLRTSNFTTDTDGLPLENYDAQLAREYLKQENLGDYFLLNAIGGKSWKLGDYYIGLFVSLNNILDQLYKTGGYEQSRNANFNSLQEDREREMPVFGNRYWYGYGTTYFANLYVRF
ncbi:TonB-dependent receptor [Zunongwangia sp. SCSIO 43204]|uniref:TonB-dependent receptor n=1 Tax=Zunongwangia sp. SCSIO 43204 TaxID=2779359 RepID=UPI001CA85988|nr:TonB-dependent receptor [Zunongwangia sp. SCSIO 43204]UAB85416.1 TonB-dependent receptor [Zunongwangia sp. SCSIO 43204]